MYATYRDHYGARYQAFGFLVDWPTLTRRPLACVHSGIHRKNIIIKVWADWELALWGDPLYDLA
ncbi:MAG: hypothetical protein ACRDSH_20185, partial [Pseudonocardiaceae bacterium]